MSKIFTLIVILTLSIPCFGLEWYSNINQKHIKNANRLFDEKSNETDKDLIAAIKAHKNHLIDHNFKMLYQFRSKCYRNTVPMINFVENVFGQSEIPNRIYFSLEGTTITDKNANIKAYYVFSNKKFETCTETIDRWKFDEAEGKWLFVSNTLSWGSPIIIEDAK